MGRTKLKIEEGIKKPDKNNLPDEELVKLFIQDKNTEALTKLLNRYLDRIYRCALRITRNQSDAEEVVQEVFLTLVKKLDTFRGESKFSSWLYRITINASYMHIRAEKKHESELSLDNYAPYDERGTLMGKVASKDWSDKPEEVLLSKEAIDIIEKAIDELPEPYRIVFHLRDIEGLSNEEVAKVLELSVPAVKSRLHRARLFLRDKLSDYFFEFPSKKQAYKV
ncbi:MAG: RNA polymerase sigma factor [Deltaproteobacteria bacterium]|nr:MAG: RNA polymerase sigma factor [Deltaproteobacteria bacterium]